MKRAKTVTLTNGRKMLKSDYDAAKEQARKVTDPVERNWFLIRELKKADVSK